MDNVKVYAKNEKQLETVINSVRIYSQDIRIKFGTSKCGVLVKRKGKHHHSEGIQLTMRGTSIWEY